MYIDLVDCREIGHRAGVSVNHVSAWTRQIGFPDPVASLSIGDIWVWGPVWGWLHHEGHNSDVDLTILASHHPLAQPASLTFMQQLELGVPESRPY